MMTGAMKGDTGELAYESVDLIYHLLVLLGHQGVALEQVWAELAPRYNK